MYSSAHHDLDLPSIPVKNSHGYAFLDDSGPLTSDYSSLLADVVGLGCVQQVNHPLPFPVEVIDMTLREALKIYEICVRAENKSERTVEWVINAARQLPEFAGGNDIDLRSITPDFIRRFIISPDERPAFTGHPHKGYHFLC